MGTQPATFVDKMPIIVVDGPLVRTTWESGESAFLCVSTRSYMRRYLETALRILNDYEAAERENVVQLRAGRH